MTKFILHNVDTAPEGSKLLLEDSIKHFGMIPNLHAVMAESPQLLDAYQFMTDKVLKSSFNAEEVTVLWLTIDVEHGCHYCVPAHTAIAYQMQVKSELIQSLLKGKILKNPKLEVLRQLTLSVIRERGKVGKKQIDDFFAAGYDRRQLLEVVLGVAHKVMSNYVNYIAQTPLDSIFKPFVEDENLN